MNKLVIPVTICALALVGAVLLLLPVEDAMAVHTTIASNINKQDRYLSFTIHSNATALENAVIIAAKSGNTLKVSVSQTLVDGSGALATFEDTSDGAVTADGSEQTLGGGTGLQIKSLAANTDTLISVVILEDAE